jgi:hypothetical protein
MNTVARKQQGFAAIVLLSFMACLNKLNHSAGNFPYLDLRHGNNP